MEAGVEIQEDSTVHFKGFPQRFSYNELMEATGGFSKESILGYGGFGVVYQAELKSCIQAAIKRMNPEATQSQGVKEFKSEVEIIGQISHRNLIKLQGYCAEGDRKEYMLVYDLMPNGSLDDALFKPLVFLSWPQKLKILTGAADGLAYLHEGLDQQVIHRDIKCSNILLDRNWNAKLADFGIARMVAHQGTAATTAMAGTVGYMAPEVFSESQFTAKADVYAFGVVILEVACRRRVFSTPQHQMQLVEWVRFAHSEGNLLSVVDKRHRKDDTKQMKLVLKVALLCTQVNPEDRPTMKHIVQMLSGNMKVPSIPTSKPMNSSSPRSIKKSFEIVCFYLCFWFSRRRKVGARRSHSGARTLTTPSSESREKDTWTTRTTRTLSRERGRLYSPTSPLEARQEEKHGGRERVKKNVSYSKIMAHWGKKRNMEEKSE